MGAWGHGPFDNDTALDFFDELESAPDQDGTEDDPDKLEIIAATLMMAGDEEDGADADVAVEGVVAAEMVAAALGRGHPSLPGVLEETESEGLAGWLERARDRVVARQLQHPDMRTLAKKALERVLRSELADLWDETDAADQWRAEVSGLMDRLA